MTSEDDVLRESLRDLIPDYQAPGDPFARVSASVRRRRVRRRTMLAIGSAATVALVATAVPTLAGLARAPSGRDTAGPGIGGGPRERETRPPSTQTGPTQTGPTQTIQSPRRLVAQDALGTAQWKVYSTRLSDRAGRCLVADDSVFDNAAWCFDDWQPSAGQPVTWGVVNEVRPDATAVFGVAALAITEVQVKLAGRAEMQVPTAPTETDPQVRFFAFVVEGSGVQVSSMVPMASGTLGGLPVVGSNGGYSCRRTAEPACAPPPP